MPKAQSKEVRQFLADFDIEMHRLREQFKTILKRYETKRVKQLKNLISHIKSL